MVNEILLGLTLAAIPGPINVEIVRNGVNRNRHQTLLFSSGVMASELTKATVVYLGLYQFLTYRITQTILWSWGCLFLTYFGIVTLKNSGLPAVNDNLSEKNNGNSFAEGFLLAFSNPLAIIFWVGIYGSMIASNLSAVEKISGAISGLSIIFGIGVWLIGFTLLVIFSRRFITHKVMTVISLLCGIALLAFAAKFGYQAITSIMNK